ncbi:hypothetical protein UFOVP518_11 [uncultured Caudovirales phage]|uniref:Uncharacterized protein n=1 Tax=uncultured Caudovirales phage TaxID=2100421 RepID=A0A6J5MU46_9CAUD|nr:hypothetical protein UFOVP518_11 [uncultured Caudovirales phage]
MKTQGKSIIVQIAMIILIVLGSFGNLFGLEVMMWTGMIGAGITLIVKTFFPSGVLVKGWDILLWATNIGMIIIQITNMVADVTWVSPAVINVMQVAINMIILIIGNVNTGILKAK